MSGVAAVPFARFALHDLLGVMLWVGTGMLLGYAFADQVDALLAILQRFGLDLGAAILLVLAGFVAYRAWRRRLLLKELQMSRISIDELYAMLATGAAPLLIDVRSSEGRAHDPWLIPGARAVDIDRLEHEIEALTRQKQVVLYCACPNEISAARVAQRMCALGFNEVRPLLGGIDAWRAAGRSEEHTSELQSLMRISYAVFCLKKKTTAQDKTKKRCGRKRLSALDSNINNMYKKSIKFINEVKKIHVSKQLTLKTNND